MILNCIEKYLMNNPIRAAIQRHYEAAKLLRMGGTLDGGKVLEVGCGRGVGVQIIFDLFGANHVDAFDLDPKMVNRAESRLKKYGSKVELWTGSVTEIPADDNKYGAVFDFGVVHHIPNWQEAVQEVYRVLTPGGHFYCEEVYRSFILHPIWKRLLNHPLENRFDHLEFGQHLEKTGFKILSSDFLGSWFGWYVVEK